VLLKNCENSSLDLYQLVIMVSCLQSKKRGKFWAKFRLAFKQKQGLRDKLAIYTASINMFPQFAHSYLAWTPRALAYASTTTTGIVSHVSLWLGAGAMMTTAPQRTETERWRREESLSRSVSRCGRTWGAQFDSLSRRSWRSQMLAQLGVRSCKRLHNARWQL
jgi:hypothetical protein